MLFRSALSVTANQTTLSMSSPQSSTVATSFGTGSTLPVQILGLAQTPTNSVGAYAVLLAKWNTHQYFGGKAGA